MKTLSVVIPVYNGAPFIRESLLSMLGYLGRRGESELIVVDDGSTDLTADILAEVERHPPTRGVSVRLLSNDRNRGKGYSVRRGLSSARGEIRVFTDADLAYPVENLSAIEGALQDGADLAIANRVHRESRYVMAPRGFREMSTRHTISRVFNRVVQASVVSGVSDTQAGLKGLSRHATVSLLPRLTMDRFAFDVELLLVARRQALRIVEVPVVFHYSNEPSSLQLARDGARMLLDLATIRQRAERGAYDGPAPLSVARQDAREGGDRAIRSKP